MEFLKDFIILQLLCICACSTCPARIFPNKGNSFGHWAARTEGAVVYYYLLSSVQITTLSLFSMITMTRKDHSSGKYLAIFLQDVLTNVDNYTRLWTDHPAGLTVKI